MNFDYFVDINLWFIANLRTDKTYIMHELMNYNLVNLQFCCYNILETIY